MEGGAYRYDTQTSSMVEITPTDPLIGRTLGLRFAGASPAGDVVFMGGPDNRDPVASINLFAFDAVTGALIGSTHNTDYVNVRKSVVSNGALYLGVRGKGDGGEVLKWTGSHDKNIMQFQSVAHLDGEVNELIDHEGYLFATTSVNGRAQAGVFRSPVKGVLNPGSGPWVTVFRAGDYEPDGVTAYTYAIGALASFQGKVVFGTMHFPFVAATAHRAVYGGTGGAGLLQDNLHTQRAISVFSVDGATTTAPNVRTLYGESKLDAWVPNDPRNPKGPGRWVSTLTKSGAPLLGPSGFGNPYNTYTWNMAVHNGKLYLGTFDWSYVLGDNSGLVKLFPTGLPCGNGYGADPFRLNDTTHPGAFVDTTGQGNQLNYGIRNSVSMNGALYLGMTNPMNLATDPGPFGNKPTGGWELLKASL